MAKDVVIQSAPEGVHPTTNGFDEISKFDALIWEKGYDVVHEKCLQCPCKSVRVNQLSNCKNCGGTGWVFINPSQTRMVLRNMNENTSQKSWSKENIGTVNISIMNRDHITYMDRITLLKSVAYFNEVRHFKMSSRNDLLFVYCSYNIKKINYVGLFVDESTAFTRLKEGDDYRFEGNRLFLNAKYNDQFQDDNTFSVTVSYEHFPQYYIQDIPRQVATSRDSLDGQEELDKLPIAAVGRRAHFVLDAENISQDRLLDNSFIDNSCTKQIKSVVSFGDLLSCCKKK